MHRFHAPTLIPVLFAVASLGAALLAPLACGGDATPASDTSAPTDVADAADAADADTIIPIPGDLAGLIAAFCPPYAAAFCARVDDCGCNDIPGFPTDCTTAFESACARDFETYRNPIESGQAMVRTDGIAGCLAAFETAASRCVSLPNEGFFAFCPILAPAGPDVALPAAGQPCQSGMCAAGLRCASDGTCKAPGALSAPCTSHRDCALDLLCTDDVCTAPATADVGKSCSGPEGCSGQTACMASARKICGDATGSAGPCRWDEDCGAFAYCAIDYSQSPPPETGLCAAAPGDGEPCANAVVCGVGLGCNSEGLCAPLPGLDAPCALGRMGPNLCVAGLTCVDGTCRNPPGEGEACFPGENACADGLGCAFEADGSYCRQRRGAGAECQNDPTCAEGFFCNFNIGACEAARQVGEPCKDGNECGAAGACLPDATFTFRCAPKPGRDEACFIDECQDGLQCRSPYSEGICAPVLCGMLRF